MNDTVCEAAFVGSSLAGVETELLGSGHTTTLLNITARPRSIVHYDMSTRYTKMNMTSWTHDMKKLKELSSVQN